MGTLLSAAGLIVGLFLLWTWRLGLEVSSFQATLVSVIEVTGFVLSVVALGWLGVVIFVGVSLVALITWSIVLAVRKQSILVGASVRGADLSREQAEELWRWMGIEESFAALGPIKRAELIRELADKARGPEEIRAMAPRIAGLSIIFECDPIWLAPRFDRLLRLYGHGAGESESVADTLTASTQLGAASFEEIVDAMLVAGEPVEAGPTQETGDDLSKEKFRENLRAAAEVQIHQDGEDGIRLNGGPLDGWLVLADAPSLAADWYMTWPPGYAVGHGPGRYRLAESGTWAEWSELDSVG